MGFNMKTLASTIALSIALGLLDVASAQGTKNQINVTMCNWRQLRANVVRDTVYLDGGSLWWERGFSDGTKTQDNNNGNSDGTMFALSFNTSFDTTSTNMTETFDQISRTGSSAANNIAPNYIDGVMFTNDYVFFTYGGLLRPADNQPPNEDAVYGYEFYQYGPAKTSWEPGPVYVTTGNEDMTRYVTNGAGVSAPSENTGFYFSGMRGKDWGPIRDISTLQANETSDKLITVDMSEFREPKFSNLSIPDAIPRRANAELVWLPVSESGLLVAIGGATNPEVIYGGNGMSDSQIEENEEEDPSYMESIPIYDVGSGNWYMQNTTGDTPPALTQFCSAVGIADDKSSYNIYIYGGYDGIERTQKASDDVYVLSIPSFVWIKVYEGDSRHGRRGHKCVTPYPDQMMVLGGIYTDVTQCLEGGIIQVFNMNKLKFQDSYDPEEWEEYRVPDMITEEIGGDAKGGATTKEPDKWSDDDLKDLFSTEYSKTIKTYYPYEPAEASSTSTSDPSDKEEDDDEGGGGGGGGGGLPDWVGAVLGVVLGLVFITGMAVLWLIMRRRREKRYPQSVGATSDNRKRILGWMYGMGLPTQKAADMTTDKSTEIGINEKQSGIMSSDAGMESVTTPPVASTVRYSDTGAREAGSSPIIELYAGPVPNRTELPDNQIHTSTSETPSFNSPVSPAVSPTPDDQSASDVLSRPGHNRHPSSLSSMGGMPLSIDNAVAGENRRSHHRVSDFKEEFSEEPDPPGPKS